MVVSSLGEGAAAPATLRGGVSGRAKKRGKRGAGQDEHSRRESAARLAAKAAGQGGAAGDG